MQPVPHDVLQGPEQQGKDQAEARSEGPGPPAEGRREMDPREHCARPAPLAFAPEDSAHSSPPSSSSSPTPSLYRAPAPRTSRRGRRAVGPPASSSPPPLRVKAHQRPPLGPRTQTPPSRPPTSATLPSQLMGGRAGTDARGLRERGHDRLGPDSHGLPSYLASPSASERSDSATARQEQEVIGTPFITGDEPPPATSDGQTTHESPAASSESGSSRSFASSFAYFLRDRRSDKRLLHKHSQPPHHLQTPTASPPPGRPEATRSPSYYKPKIVEDTLASLPQLAPPLHVPASSILPPTTASPLSPATAGSQYISPSPAVATSSLKRSSRKRDHSSSPNTRESPARKVRSRSPISPPPSQPEDAAERPRLQRSETVLPRRKPLPTRQGLRVQLPSAYPNDRDEIVADDRNGGVGSTTSEPPSSVREAFGRTSGPFTPLEIQPHSPRISHGEHYFRTFGEDTVYEKPQPVFSPKLPVIHPSLDDTSMATGSQPAGDHNVVQNRPRKRDSLLLALKKLPLTEETLGVPKSRLANTPAPVRPILSVSRGTRSSNRSDSSKSSYFGLGRRQQSSSDHHVATPSPMATHWEAVTARAGHAQEYSEPLSPMTCKAPKLRWAQQVTSKRTSEEMSSSEQSEELATQHAGHLVPSAAPSLPAMRSKYLSSDGKEYDTTALTGPDALNFLPSEMKRIDTPPLKEASPARNKLRAFKSFFFDFRSLPTEDTKTEESAWRGTKPTNKKHARLMSKISSQSLALKLLVPFLRHTPSRLTEERRESDPLAVTGFQQTPFSQRYGDALRAKQTQTHAYIWDETLRDDDDSVSSAGRSFELSLPDHLTNSPLCPLNEKHRAGGKATCPVHGRKRTSVNAYPPRKRTIERREGNRGGRREPTIVFESGQRGNASAEEHQRPRGFA